MGQQPNIEATEANRPRSVPQPPAARRWRPTRPGDPTTPGQVPKGGMFGTAAPDGGYALRIISASPLPDDDPDLRLVLAALMVARAGALGRGPTHEDLEVALILCGYGFDAKPEVVERRERWLDAVHSDLRPGETAVADIDVEFLVAKPEQVRWGLSHTSDHVMHSGEHSSDH